MKLFDDDDDDDDDNNNNNNVWLSLWTKLLKSLHEYL